MPRLMSIWFSENCIIRLAEVLRVGGSSVHRFEFHFGGNIRGMRIFRSRFIPNKSMLMEKYSSPPIPPDKKTPAAAGVFLFSVPTVY